jgi:hypothetical protein
LAEARGKTNFDYFILYTDGVEFGGKKKLGRILNEINVPVHVIFSGIDVGREREHG